MDSEEFRRHGKEMVDFVADFWTTLRDRTPLPDVQPGYVKDLVPAHPPSEPESWEVIFRDLEEVVLKRNTNWHHPHFFAYFSAACSYQSIMADILGGGLGSVGHSWKSGPALVELERTTMDWLVDILGLPQYFKNSSEGPGVGFIQYSASDSTLIAIMAARAQAVETTKRRHQEEMRSNWLGKIVSSLKCLITDLIPSSILKGIAYEDVEVNEGPQPTYFHDPSVFKHFVAYCSDQAHSSVEKCAMLSGVRLRKLKSSLDDRIGNYTVTKDTLKAAIRKDRSRGLTPFIMVASVGSTNTCGVDWLDELGPVCKEEGIWLHVDAAYAGSFLICPEFRYLSKGIEYADSIGYNAHKAMMVNLDCSPMWFKNGKGISKYFNVSPDYEVKDSSLNLTHLQVPLSRRFRALKLWFVLRNLGTERIQENLRKQDSQSKIFASLIEEENCFELVVPSHLGLVCFRLKNSSNEKNEKFYDAINRDERVHLVPAEVHGTFFLRLAICSQLTTDDDIRFVYSVFRELCCEK